MSSDLKKSLESLIGTISKNPKSGKAVFRANTFSDNESFATNSEIREFDVRMDEPDELGGGDTGPNPVEMLLAALGSCQEIVYRAYAAVLDLNIESIEVKAKGYLDLQGLLNLDDVPAGFSNIQYETRIISDEPEEEILKLTALVESHCPVMDTIMRAVPVNGRVTLEKATEITPECEIPAG